DVSRTHNGARPTGQLVVDGDVWREGTLNSAQRLDAADVAPPPTDFAPRSGHGVRKTSEMPAISSVSPSTSFRVAVRTPLTFTPFCDPRSFSSKPLPATVMTACLRDTSGL